MKMKTRFLGLVCLLAALAFVSTGFAQTPAVAPVARDRQWPPGTLKSLEDLPAHPFKQRVQQLPPAARQRALEWLQRIHFTELDLDSLDVDAEGGIHFACHFTPIIPREPTTAESEPDISEAAVPVSPFPASLIFHSRPGAPNVLYLDFDGENVTGTQWNDYLNRTTIPALAFSSDADFITFSDSEQTAIKRIWQRVAEDFAPFNIDVTTERPMAFNSRTAHALITRRTDANGEYNPDANNSGVAGVAYTDVFNTDIYSGGYAYYRPAWIYNNQSAVNNDEFAIAECVSHEVGHNMGLSHDGKTDGTSYYSGHGSGDISWSPLMGNGLTYNVSQWSKGEYYLANNTQDDLAIIAGKLSYRADDHGNTTANATPLVLTGGTNVVSTTPENDPANTNPANKGVLAQRTDVDVFSFTAEGSVSLSVKPWLMTTGTRGGDLDVLLELHNAAGTLLLTNNVADKTDASIVTNLPGGSYYFYVRNTGTGNPLSSTPTGYTDYASLGQYFISGTIAPLPFTYTTNAGGLTITAYIGSATAVVIPASINGYPVVRIGDWAFADKTTLTSMTIPNSVTNIGVSAFSACFGLTSITIPNSVKNIGDSAFYYCYALTRVVIPNSVTSIGNAAFYLCTGLTNVTIGNGVTSIGTSAFRDCISLTSVVIGNSMTNIGGSAFSGCTSLTNITFLGNAPSLGSAVFTSVPGTIYYYYGTTGWGADFGGLPTVMLGGPVPANVLTWTTNIGAITITGYVGPRSGVTNVVIPDTINSYPVTSIGDSAFYNCYSLTNVVIGNSVTSIGAQAFRSCTNLTSITIPDSVTSIGNEAFDSCASLRSVTIGNGVTYIGYSAFQNCKSLTSVTIPDSVTDIDFAAFMSCTSLRSVVIGNGLTSLTTDVFWNCTSLTNLTFLGNAPTLLDDSVFGIPGTVYYHYGTTGWGTTYGGRPTVMLGAPVPQIGGGSNAGIQSGNFGFTISGVPLQTIVVEASTNLVNWQPIWTNRLSSAATNFVDSQWQNFPARFYRAR